MQTTTRRAPLVERARGLAALALVALAALLALNARAQGLPDPGDGFTWERVGDVGIDVEDLTLGSDSTLWAVGIDGPYRLDLSGGFPGQWVLVRDFSADTILPLGRGPDGDTLVVGRGGVYRSTDGGATFVEVHDRGGDDALYEVPSGYPYAGRILAGGSEYIAYSDDRGASFTASVIPAPGGNRADADDFVALPPDSEHPGRILAAGRWGVNVSDDGGATFRESGLWQVLYYVGEGIAAVEPPDPAEGAVGVMVGRVSAQADARAWRSTDGGQTWGPGDGLRLLEGPPNDGSPRSVFALGGSSALAVLGGGTVYRSDDAGETWTPVGRAPEISTLIYAKAAALGPDGRLYVGLHEVGLGRGWAWRTAERLTAAVTTEAAPLSPPVVLSPEGGSFRFRVTLTNQTDEVQAVEAWTKAAGPLSVSPVLGPVTVTLPPGGTLTRALTQRVPANAPSGTYTYTVAVGDFPGILVSSDAFPVVKQGAPVVSGSADAEGWAVSGWEEPPAVALEGAVRLAVTPNPFQGEAVVTLALAEPARVSVSVYDVLGRRVALLHRGALEAGAHDFHLDGSALPAGVYVVRAAAGGAVAAYRATLLQ